VVGRALRGPGAAEGWDFEPGARLGYTVNPKLELSMEYYGSTGVINDPLPSAQQVHQFFPGADINLSENVVLNVGVGFGATDAGNTQVYKMRLGWIF
jgi:predicted porin